MLSCLKILKKSMVPQLCFSISFFMSGIIVNLVQCILYLGLRPVNRRLYRKINWYLCYTIYSQLVWLAEWWAGMKIVLYMDKNDFDKHAGKSHGIVIANHTYEIDWLVTMVLADKMNFLGNIKAYVKKSVQYFPAIGWAWKLSDFIFLERSFEKDKKVIENQLKELTNYPDPMVLTLYPEGTRFTQKKHKASEEFARLNKLPSLKYHLQPRTRGFITSLPPMKGKVLALYDTIIAFAEDDPVEPAMLNVTMGECATAYVYIKRIPMDDLPNSEDGLRKFCEDIYVRKDKLKESFVKTGDFFATSGVPRTDRIVLNRRYYSLINTMLWAIIILCPMVYNIIGLLFSGSPLYCAFGISIVGIFVSLLYMALIATQKNKGSSYGTTNKSKQTE